MGRFGRVFHILHTEIIFFGLNIIGGNPHSCTEWRDQHTVDLNKVKEITTVRKDNFSVAVLFDHTLPGSYHGDFSGGEDGLAQFARKKGKQFLHLYGDNHSWNENEGAFGVDNYMMVCGYR